MRASICRSIPAALIGASLAVVIPSSARANVITDWDDKAVVVVTPMASLGNPTPYMAERIMAMVHAAMFDAVNSVEPRYRPYLVQLPADPATSKEAAAAAAAAAVLGTIDGKTASEMKTALATYLTSIPDGSAKLDGVISSVAEARIIKKACGREFQVVTPGIRPAGTALHDHRRSGTPGAAIASGADYLVVGRPITQHEDPAAQASRIIEEMQAAVAGGA